MLALVDLDSRSWVSRDRVLTWMPEVALVGPEAIPAIKPLDALPRVDRFVAYDKTNTASSASTSLIHFFVDDRKINAVLRQPGRYLERFSGFAGVTCPDVSIYGSMPRHARIASVFQSRAAGAYFQHHGVRVVPVARWFDESDFDYCFAGLPAESPIAVSPHGCSRTRDDRARFRRGLVRMVDEVSPSLLIVHGSAAPSIFEAVGERIPVLQLDSEKAQAHGRGRTDGGR